MDINRTYLCATFAGIIFACQATNHHPLARAEKIDAADQTQRIRQIVLSRGDDPAGLAHLIQLSSDLQPSAAVNLYRQLAEDYLRTGQFDKAADVLRQLVDQHLSQPAAAEGLLSLVRLYASSEVAHTTKKSLRKSEENSLPIYSLYLAQQALGRQHDLANNPAIAFQCAVASRLAGNLRSAKSWLSPLKHSRHNESWHQCARVETWLQDQRDTEPPKPAVHCALADQPPLLDGKLDEKFWQLKKPISLAADSTQIRLAYDDKFLYLSASCQKIGGENYASEKLPRSYDADLAGQDHVRLLLDLDRDYATCFELAIDHRGQTADRCWLNTSWNPRWFVATSSNDVSWTVEAAIPWTELTSKPPHALDAWALAVTRQSAAGEPQTWVGSPAKDPGPASFGLLLFD